MKSHVSTYILMDQCAIVCSNVGKKYANNNQGTFVIHYKGKIKNFAYKRIPVVDMTIKLGLSANPLSTCLKLL